MSLCTPGRRMYCLMAFADPSEGIDCELCCDVYPVIAIRDCDDGLPELMVLRDDYDYHLQSFDRILYEFKGDLPEYIMSYRVVVMTGHEYDDGREIEEVKSSLMKIVKSRVVEKISKPKD